MVTAAKEWRCFHCDEVFTNEADAGVHFGAAPDGRAGCLEKVSAPEQNLLLALRLVIEEFRRLQLQVSEEITNDAYFYGRLRSSLALIKPFKDCISLHEVANLFDSLEGRVLAAEDLWGFVGTEYLHLIPFAMPTGQGDADVGWKVLQTVTGIGDVEVAVVYEDNARLAINEARKNLDEARKETRAEFGIEVHR